MISQLLALPRQPLLPLEGEDVAHVPVQHGPHHEDGGVVRFCRTPKEREEENSTETIRMSAVPMGHPGAGLDLTWRGSLLGHGQYQHHYGRMQCLLSPCQVSISPKGGLSAFGVTRHPRCLPSCKTHSSHMTGLVLPHSEIPLIPPTAPQQANLQGGKVSCSQPEAFEHVHSYQAIREKNCTWTDKGSQEGEMSHCIWSDHTTRVLLWEAAGAMVSDEPLNHLCDLWGCHLTSSSSASR